MKKIQILAISFTVLISCTSKDKNIENSINIIELANNNETELELSKICSDVKFVRLNTEKDHLIGRVDKLIMSQGRFYILDKISKSIIVFDTTGKYKTKISNIGRGPGEYADIGDFTVNTYNNSIDIYDRSTQSILIFDLNGTLIEILNLGIRLKYFEVIDKNKYLIFTNKLTKPEDSKMEFANNILIINKNGRVHGKYFPYNVKSSSRTLYNEQTLLRFNNNLFVNLMFHDTIYTIENNKLLPYYYINYGKNRLPNEFRAIDNLEGLDKLLGTNYSLFINFLCETKNLLFMTYLQGNRQHYAIYNKNNYTTNMFSTVSNDINELPFSKSFIPISETFNQFKRSIPIIISSNNNEMYGFLYPHEIQMEALNKNFPGVGVNDNPIILIYKLKN